METFHKIIYVRLLISYVINFIRLWIFYSYSFKKFVIASS